MLVERLDDKRSGPMKNSILKTTLGAAALAYDGLELTVGETQ